MQPSSQDTNQNYLNKYISSSSPKFKSLNNPIIKQLKKLITQQETKFGEIQEGCSFLENCILTIEDLVQRIQQRVNSINQFRQTQTISNLKNKQNEFIINELKQKIKKYQKNQQNNDIELRHLKKQIENLKRQYINSNNQEKSELNTLKQEILILEKSLKQKNTLIQELNQNNQKLTQIRKQDNRKTANQKIKKQKDQEYRQLESKLIQLERQFDLKITSLLEEVTQKNNKIQSLEEILQSQYKQFQKKSKAYELKISNLSYKMENNQDNEEFSGANSMTYTFNPTKKSPSSFTQPSVPSSSSSASVYQLQLKLTQQQKLYKELQLQYTGYLSSSNNTQIQLHQQIHQHKNLLQEQKKKSRSQKKKCIQSLQGLASFINKRNFNYFQTSEIQVVIEQLKKIYSKQKQKYQQQITQTKGQSDKFKQRFSQLQKQNRKYKNEVQLLKNQIQSLKQQIQKMNSQRQKQKQKIKKRQTSSVITQSNQKNKSSLNGSIGQISNGNSKSQTPSVFQQKYRQLIDSLRSQIKIKQQHILQLQSLQAVDFQKSKQKILSIQSQLADTKNDLKKLTRQRKQLHQTIKQLTKQIQTLKSTLNLNKQKHNKQKQQLKQQYQQKHKTQQQRYCKLKQQNQSIDAKCQQRIMKYNKLKSKMQKLEMYNSETQKRKDTQIQDLIKKNQQVKMDYKLIEEKYNILQNNANINLAENLTPKQEGGYNRDLIQQIQMERDRILEQYETKRRENLKMKEITEKLEQEKGKIQQQKNKLHLQIQKLTTKAQNQDQQLKQLLQNITALKKKIQSIEKQLTQQRQLKSLLQKQLSKLTQQSTQKSKNQYQHLKKQLQNQIQSRKKLQKQQPALVQRIKQLKQQNQKLKKQQSQKQKILSKQLQVKYSQKLKQKSHHYHEEINKYKLENEKKIKVMEQKLSEANIRQQSLINIVNYKNNNDCEVRESMRCEGNAYMKEDFNDVKSEELEDIVYPEGEVQEKSHSTIIYKVNQETSTEEIALSNKYLSTVNLQCITILPQINKSKVNLTIQKLPSIHLSLNISEQNQIKQAQYHKELFNSTQTSCNIFQQEQELLKHLKQNYSLTLDYLINSSTPYRQLEQLTRTQPLQISETVDIGINTDQQITTKQAYQIHQISLKNDLPKQIQKQNRFILEDQLLGSFHSSEDQEKNKFQEEDHQKNISFKNLDKQQQNHHDVKKQIASQPRIKFNIQSNRIEQINLFQNLKPSNMNINIDEQNIDDNFEICEQGQSINVGQTALNLQIKQIFNKLREQLQKVFNGEQISLSMIRILPRQLEDDYNQLIAYIREKIEQIKTQNNLSFIMAEVGDEPEQIQQQLDDQLKSFLDKKISGDMFTMRRMIQQKQALITSLMNERTLQQNTINQMTMQKQQLDQEHENRFMNQCTIYKRQIKQLKNKVDSLQMNFQSLKNIFKKSMEIWADDYENQDDLKDNFIIYQKIAKLTENQQKRLHYYLSKYRKTKGIQDE